MAQGRAFYGPILAVTDDGVTVTKGTHKTGAHLMLERARTRVKAGQRYEIGKLGLRRAPVRDETANALPRTLMRRSKHSTAS